MESVCRPGVRSNILASDPSVASNVIALLKEVFFSTHQTPIKDCDDMWNFQSFVKQFHLWLFFFENSTFLHQFFSTSWWKSRGHVAISHHGIMTYHFLFSRLELPQVSRWWNWDKSCHYELNQLRRLALVRISHWDSIFYLLPWNKLRYLTLQNKNFGQLNRIFLTQEWEKKKIVHAEMVFQFGARCFIEI